MYQPSREADVRLFFGSLNVMVVESGSLERNILVQVLTGFKVKGVVKYSNANDAMEHLQHETTDLLIVGSATGEMDSYAFIRCLRHSADLAVQMLPVILLTGHTQHDNIIRARDCGANFVVAKPITPYVLYGRMAWLARDPRKFVTSEDYTGPDRRFQVTGIPTAVTGRRKGDQKTQMGEASSAELP